MKSAYVKDKTYIKKEVNDECPYTKVCDCVRMLKDKKVFKGYTTNWSEEAFVTKKVKNIVLWTYVINDLSDEEIGGRFFEKELKKRC